MVPPDAADWVALGADPLPVAEAAEWATVPAAGAVVSFLGVVREESEGRAGVTHLTYEAYEEEAAAAMTRIVAELRLRWPSVARVALLHRVGDLALGEASVAVVVSAPHRADAFDAARFGIDTLKETVPIWKQEHWADGSGWALGAAPIRPVAP